MLMKDTTDGIVPLIAPDIVLPTQLPTTGGQARRTMAEYQLLVAVLDDAVRCFQKYLGAKNRRQRRLFNDAEVWIMRAHEVSGRNAEDAAPSFSFEYVCDTLGIDANDVRELLRRWRDGQPGRVSQAA
jgi:hypothetical protein